MKIIDRIKSFLRKTPKKTVVIMSVNEYCFLSKPEYRSGKGVGQIIHFPDDLINQPNLPSYEDLVANFSVKIETDENNKYPMITLIPKENINE